MFGRAWTGRMALSPHKHENPDLKIMDIELVGQSQFYIDFNNSK